MGIKKDINEHSFSNILRGWITSLFVGVPLFYMAFALPVTWGVLALSYNPELYVRCGMCGIGILAMLAPNKLPSVILDAFDFTKDIIKKRNEK